ncbi:hypothetical protein HPT27_10655 [Permianibacter sp. IMCC34836]|uniref:hypothetical protein n=1 Tax=Permianibacter fluminis TaxID=2738515 RepID=UPI00155721C2|nr:hypothetical protein [Permianibacter fluminis]NQD37488.1 hypothetical protein [Permianibacter fluminis]
MAEKYTAWFWRARCQYGKRQMYTTRHRMDEQNAIEYFAREGITEYSKVETSARVMTRLSSGDAAEHFRNIRPGDADYIQEDDQQPRHLRCVDESIAATTPPCSE